jgi:hypothetical protein
VLLALGLWFFRLLPFSATATDPNRRRSNSSASHTGSDSDRADYAAPVELREALDRIEQLQREREALDGSYADLKAEVDAAYAPTDPEERERRLAALLGRLATYVDMERRQSRISFELVMDAYQRLVKAHDE